MNLRAIQLTLCGACLLMFTGCERKAAQASAATVPTAAAPTPASIKPAAPPAMQSFEHKESGLLAQYPGNWTSKKDKDYELLLVPADGSSGRQITIDIPDLPPHFPGMIRLSLIENGFLRDLKSQHNGLHVDKAEDHGCNCGAKGRLVESSWTEGGNARKQVALLMMRGERVFILAYECNAADCTAVQNDYDKVAASLSWTK